MHFVRILGVTKRKIKPSKKYSPQIPITKRRKKEIAKLKAKRAQVSEYNNSTRGKKFRFNTFFYAIIITMLQAKIKKIVSKNKNKVSKSALDLYNGEENEEREEKEDEKKRAEVHEVSKVRISCQR